MSALKFHRVTPGLYQARRGDHYYELDSHGTNTWVINHGKASVPGAGLTEIGRTFTRKQAIRDALAHFAEVDR